MKAEGFFKYSLLVDLTNIVTKYGRDYNFKYNFNKDEKLKKITEGPYSSMEIDEKTKITLSIDGFTTIWLIMLPEKFEQLWMKSIIALGNTDNGREIMSLTDKPIFPKFKKGKITTLENLPEKNTSKFLPDSWNLLKCFEHYMKQNEKWSTPSIKKEYFDQYAEDDDGKQQPSQKKRCKTIKTQEEDGEEAQVVESEEEEGTEVDNKNLPVAIKTDTDDEQEEKVLASRSSSRKRSSTNCYTEKGEGPSRKKKKKEGSGLITYSTAAHWIKEMSPLLTNTLAKVEELEMVVKGPAATTVKHIKSYLAQFQEIKTKLNVYAKQGTRN